MNEMMTQMAVPMNLGGLIGLLAGLVLGLAGWGFGKYMQRKNRGLDERTAAITDRAKAFAWNLLVPSILVCWVVVILFDGIGLAFFVMTALFAVSQIAYVAGAVYQNGRN